MYLGVRVRFLARIGRARQTMRLDVGFGDAALVQENLVYPTLLDKPAPILLGYQPESAVSEKYQTIVSFGLVNSRMKDYYDIWLLSRHFRFNGLRLSKAIAQTFKRRHTSLEKEPVGLTSLLSEDSKKIAQWRAFLARAEIFSAPSLPEAAAGIAELLLPRTSAVMHADNFNRIWEPPGPWVTCSAPDAD